MVNDSKSDWSVSTITEDDDDFNSESLDESWNEQKRKEIAQRIWREKQFLLNLFNTIPKFWDEYKKKFTVPDKEV